MRALAARSVGQARAAMTLAAAETAGDYELQQGGIANSGTVEAVAPLAATPNEYVVVTPSRQAPPTPPPTGTRTRLARRARHRAASMPGGGWALSGWQPEN